MLEKFELLSVFANGINHRVAFVKEGRNSTVDSTTPLIMLLHGWPEGWYCWRHQLLALHNAGYHNVCAPDMRGFGGTDAPTAVDDYTIDIVCRDVIEIAKAVGGYQRIVVVGHDFGAYLAWHLALLHPSNVVAVCAMSVPYVGHSPRNEPLLTKLQTNYGKCLPRAPYFATRDEQLQARFNYILHHNLPYADQEYDKNCEEFLYRIYGYQRGRVEADPPEVTSKLMFLPAPTTTTTSKSTLMNAKTAPGWWTRIPRPTKLPPWLPHTDFQILVKEYQTHKFAGGLKWYQAMEANWYQTLCLRGKCIEPPSLFVCGDEDMVLKTHGGKDVVQKALQNNCADLRGVIFVRGAGHWIQQQCATKVNEVLLEFLQSLPNSKL